MKWLTGLTEARLARINPKKYPMLRLATKALPTERLIEKKRQTPNAKPQIADTAIICSIKFLPLHPDEICSNLLPMVLI
jgi:hypothetical protein